MSLVVRGLGVVLLLAFVGCSEDGGGDEAQNGGAPSGGASNGGTTTGGTSGVAGALGGTSGAGAAGATGGTSGASGSAGSAGTGGVAGPFECTLGGADCEAGTACFVEQHEDGTFSSACHTAGGAGQGMPCAVSADCVSEMYCGPFGTCLPAPGCCGASCTSCGGGECVELAGGAKQVGAICAVYCSAGESCRDGMSCVDNRCVYGTVGAEGATCNHTLGCAAGLTCTIEGKCARTCEEVTDCLAGERCAGFATPDDVVYATALSFVARVCVIPCFVSGSACPGGRCYGALLTDETTGEDAGVCGRAGSVSKNGECTADEECGPDLTCLAFERQSNCYSHCGNDAACGMGETCLSLGYDSTTAGVCVPSCNVATGEGCGTGSECRPAPNPEGSVSPGCVAGQGSTCVGADCALQFGMDPCAGGAFCHEGTCRQGCLTDTDCTQNDVCGSLGTACTGALSETVRFCQ